MESREKPTLIEIIYNEFKDKYNISFKSWRAFSVIIDGHKEDYRSEDMLIFQTAIDEKHICLSRWNHGDISYNNLSIYDVKLLSKISEHLKKYAQPNLKIC